MYNAATLLFSNRPTFFSAAVRFLTGGRWSHIDLIDPSDYNYVIGSTGQKGVHRIKISSRLQSGTTGAVVEVPGLPAQEMADFIKPWIGASYDYGGLARFILPWHEEDPTKMFCSELIATAILKVRPDFPVIRKMNASEVTPQDIWRGCRAELLQDHVTYVNGREFEI